MSFLMLIVGCRPRSRDDRSQLGNPKSPEAVTREHNFPVLDFRTVLEEQRLEMT